MASLSINRDLFQCPFEVRAAPTVLVVTDRRTGDVKRIACTDHEFHEDIALAGRLNGLTVGEALTLLLDGNELNTPRSVRRLEPQ